MSSDSSSSSSAQPLTGSPAPLIRDALIAAIRDANTGLDSDQVRAAFDVSGEPRGTASVIVSCADQGGHAGMRERILVDCRATVSVMTHLDEDLAGTLSDEILNAIIPVIQSLTPSIEGWAVRHVTPWQASEPTSDGAFRITELTANYYTQSQAPFG